MVVKIIWSTVYVSKHTMINWYTNNTEHPYFVQTKLDIYIY